MTEPRAKAKWQFKCPIAYFTKLSEIPDAAMPVHGKSSDDCDEENKMKVRELVRRFTQFRFNAQYDVQVVEKAEDAEEGSNNGGERVCKTLSVTINILDEALKYLTHYFQFKEAYQFMRLSDDSCRLLFMVSMAMASCLEMFQEKVRSGASLQDLIKFMIQAGLLVEGKPTRNPIIDNQVLRLTPTQYAELNESKVTVEDGTEMDEGTDRNGSESADEFEAVVFDLC